MLVNQLTEIAPAGALAAAIGWGAISYAFGGPELADRIGHTDYFDGCQQTLSTSLSESFSAPIAEMQEVSELELQAQVMRREVNALRSQYGAQWDAFDRLMGGALSRAVRQAEEAERRARDARERAVQVLEQRRNAAIDSAPDQCSCQITAALNESRTDWALYAGTFGLVELDGVSGFPSLMRSNSRMCSERVQP